MNLRAWPGDQHGGQPWCGSTEEAVACRGPKLAGGQPVFSHNVFKVKKKARGSEAVSTERAKCWCSLPAAVLEHKSKISMKAGRAGGEDRDLATGKKGLSWHSRCCSLCSNTAKGCSSAADATAPCQQRWWWPQGGGGESWSEDVPLYFFPNG